MKKEKETAKEIKNENKNLILVRGLPGSGKTTFANLISAIDNGKKYPVISADDYFYDEDGNYNFDASKLGSAHGYCKYETQKQLKKGVKYVFVANTFTKKSEFGPYINLANQYGYNVFSIIVENRHDNESVHDVPREIIIKMKDRFDIRLVNDHKNKDLDK
jgi:predicted kinase